MNQEDINIDDWERILMGLVPPIFLIEVVFRIVFTFIVLLVAIRLLGNRLALDMSRLELVTKVTLASALGMSLQSPDSGLLPSLVVAIVAVVAARIISYFSSRHRKFEIFTQDSLSVLVEDDVMHRENMSKNYICRQRLLAQLRSNSIYHLGEVKRLYIEANGSFTLIKCDNPGNGLSVIPEWDREMRKEQKYTDQKVCSNCGKEKNNSDKCGNCNESNWENAVAGSVKEKQNENKVDESALELH